MAWARVGGQRATRAGWNRLSGAWTARRPGRVLSGAAVLTVIGLAATFQPGAAAAQTADPTATYIVHVPSRADAGVGVAQSKVTAVSGTVRDDLAEGVVADLTATQAAALRSDPTVAVSADTAVTFDAVTASTTTTRAATDVFHTVTKADALVAGGNDGTGRVVAVLDTGIAPLADFAGRLLPGVDLSGENNPNLDSYGHGTFVAGLIAGNGASSAGRFKGEAPGASLVPIKVSGASGAVRTSTVIEGLDWAIAHKATLHIDVLNLSFGTDASESTTTSPLNAAVERAWQAGIVVVTSAGNYGPTNGSISKPGDDPLVITVGATDDNGTVPTTDDTVPSFSSVGPTWADGWFKPDLAAPGRSVVSVMAPNSTIAAQHPEGFVAPANFRGSGTSFSTAIASGAAALILNANPTASPDNVKGRMLGTAAPGPVGNPFVDGHGVLDARAAAGASNIAFSQSNVVRSGQSVQDQGPAEAWAASSWNGSAWNGSTGPGPWTGSAWNGSGWNGSGWNGSGWNGSGWNGSGWNGSGWNGSGWNGSGWNGSGWNGSAWNGSAWNGSAWNGSGWNGSGWNGSGWNGSGWNGSGWNGSGWNGSAWNWSAWNGSAWNGSGWNGSGWNGSGWNGSAWNGSGWNGSGWNGSGWSGSGWNWSTWT